MTVETNTLDDGAFASSAPEKTGGLSDAGSVAAVVLNWNGFRDTAECLASLQRATYPDLHIVVVENGSEGDEATLIARDFPEAALITNDVNAGYARACNQGIDWALERGVDYVLLLSNDTVVAPDFLNYLIAHMASHPEVGIAEPLITYHERDAIWFAGGRFNVWTGRTRHVAIDRPVAEAPGTPVDMEFATGCALLARAEVLRAVGGLDDAMFTYYEDVDLSYRVRRAGYGIALVPRSVVAHKVSATLGRRGSNRFTPGQAFYTGRNKILFAHKHLHGPQKLSFILATATLGLAEVIKRAASPRAPFSYARGFAAGLLGT